MGGKEEAGLERQRIDSESSDVMSQFGERDAMSTQASFRGMGSSKGSSKASSFVER
jgi:hypothetical protein